MPDMFSRVSLVVARAGALTISELEASNNLAIAAENMSKNPVAVHLRTLETINDLSSDQSNTVIFALPLDILKSFDTYNKKNSKE